MSNFLSRIEVDYKDFLGIYHNVYEPGFCKHIIDEFEFYAESNKTYNRKQHENMESFAKDDTLFFYDMRNLDNIKSFETKNGNRDTIKYFNIGLQAVFDIYATKFSILRLFNLSSTTMKVQRTDPGQGYHLFHCENMDLLSQSRTLVFMLYLNDIEEEGGETEFLYQKLRIKPKENTMLIWPADWTYTHRGNTVLGPTSKYIVTGWFLAH
jgi:hypothetical protein